MEEGEGRETTRGGRRSSGSGGREWGRGVEGRERCRGGGGVKSDEGRERKSGDEEPGRHGTPRREDLKWGGGG